MWVRGLKLTLLKVLATLPVAPYVGAWIETGIWTIGYGTTKSHPMWVRGLKLSVVLA